MSPDRDIFDRGTPIWERLEKRQLLDGAAPLALLGEGLSDPGAPSAHADVATEVVAFGANGNSGDILAGATTWDPALGSIASILSEAGRQEETIDFESYAADCVAFNDGQSSETTRQDNWRLTGFVNGHNTVVDVGGDKVLRVDGNGGSATGVSRKFAAPTSDTLEVRWFWRPVETTVNQAFMLLPDSISPTNLNPGWDKACVRVIMNNDGNVWTYTTVEGWRNSQVAYDTAGHNMRVLVDLTGETWDLFMDGVRIGDDLSFQAPLNGGTIDKVWLRASALGTQEVDDLQIFSYTGGQTPPIVMPSGTPATFTEDGAPVAVDDAIAIIDDQNDWNGGTITARISANAEADDRLALLDGCAGITLSGTNVIYGGNTVGTASAVTVSGGDTLTVTFNANATDAAVQAVGRAIGLSSVSQAPSTATRVVTLTATDSLGGAAAADVDVSVVGVNDAPFAEDATATVPESAANGIPVVAVAASDVDSTVSYAITAGNGDGVFAIDAATGVITIADNTSLDCETTRQYSLLVEVSDGQHSDTATVTIDVDDVNEFAPVVADAGVALPENAPSETAVHTVTASDADATGSLAYAIAGGSAAGLVRIDPASGVITVAPGATFDYESVSRHTLVVRVSDGTFQTDASITLTITDVNEAPRAEDDQATVVAGGTGVLGDLLANDTDPESDTLQIIGFSAPDRGTLTWADGSLTFHAPNDYVGPVTFTYTIDDAHGHTDTATVTVTVMAYDAPAPAPEPSPAPQPGEPAPFEPVSPEPAPQAPPPILKPAPQPESPAEPTPAPQSPAPTDTPSPSNADDNADAGGQTDAGDPDSSNTDTDVGNDVGDDSSSADAGDSSDTADASDDGDAADTGDASDAGNEKVAGGKASSGGHSGGDSHDATASTAEPNTGQTGEAGSPDATARAVASAAALAGGNSSDRGQPFSGRSGHAPEVAVVPPRPITQRPRPDLPTQNRYHQELQADSPVWRKMDAVEQEADEQVEARLIEENLAVGTVVGISSLATTAYIAWIIKTGVLIANWSASLQAWRMFDPLPVLDFKRAARRAKPKKTLWERLGLRRRAKKS